MVQSVELRHSGFRAQLRLARRQVNDSEDKMLTRQRWYSGEIKRRGIPGLPMNANETLEWWRRWESEYSSDIENAQIMIFRDDQTQKTRKRASHWNVSGKREIFCLPSRNEIELRSGTRARAKRLKISRVGFNLEGSWDARDWFRVQAIGGSTRTGAFLQGGTCRSLRDQR